jgi:DMSO reductase anchor subunit
MLLIYLQLVSFAIALICSIAFLVTGRKNRLLLGLMGVFLLIGVITQFLNRSA